MMKGQAVLTCAIHEPPRCDGEGLANLRKGVEIGIPAGVDDGVIIRLEALGNSGTNGGPSGDVLVKVQVSRMKF